MLFLPCCACVFVHATLLPVLSCVAFGTEFRTSPICIFGAYLGAASFAGQIKMRKALQPFAVTAEDRQYAACRREALLWNLLPASPQHGRWAILPGRRTAFLFHPRCFHVRYSCLCSMNRAGLQRAAVAVIGQEITHLQRWGWSQHHARAAAEFRYNGEEKRWSL